MEYITSVVYSTFFNITDGYWADSYFTHSTFLQNEHTTRKNNNTQLFCLIKPISLVFHYARTNGYWANCSNGGFIRTIDYTTSQTLQKLLR